MFPFDRSPKKIVEPVIEFYIKRLVTKNIDIREHNVADQQRKDFLHMLLQIRNTGAIPDNWETDYLSNDDDKKLTVDEVAAHTFSFLIEGLETVANSLAYFLWQMARHPGYQERLQFDIDITLATFKGEITYESINKITFLSNCVDGKYIFVLIFCNKP